MSIIRDIVKNYRAPRAVFRARLGVGENEPRALAVMFGACILVFAAQTPRLARQAFETGEELNMLLGGSLLALLFILPLVLYVLGTLTHILAKPFGGKGSGYSARFALFWALLCASPLWLLWGLVAGFIGEGIEMSVTGLIALLAFVIFWSINLRDAETGTPQQES